MRTALRVFASLSAVLLATACDPQGPAPTDDELAGESDADGEAGKADGIDSTFTYFRIERDLRKCISPLCGGFFVSRANRAYTQCADGSWDSRCYVADLDFSSSGLSSAQVEEISGSVGNDKVLLRGEVGSFVHESFGELGRLHVSEAWMGGSDEDAGGLFVRVTDSGLVCFAAPCHGTLREAKLNSVLTATMSELDLSWTDVSDEESAAAFDHVFGDDGLIVSGWRYYYYQGGWQAGRVAAQFWARVQPSPAAGECVTAGCSGQLCVEASEGDIVTTCEWLPEYACYQAATCERQPEGKCGFTPTPELDACLAQ